MDEPEARRTTMCSDHEFYAGISTIYRTALQNPAPERCMVAPAPQLNDKIRTEIDAMRSARPGMFGALSLRATEPKRDGFNDGLIIPPSEFPLGTPPSVLRSAALERAPLRGVVRVIVVLVDFADKPMTQDAQHFRDLFFSTGVIPTKSVREYYSDVTHGLVELAGEVVGPFRLPQTLASYAHAGSGIGGALPNAQTMALDALNAANPTVNFASYDNDGNGLVDAFIVIHAGGGAEETGNTNDIWSHKWTLPSGAVTTDGTKVFAYLTVPEDCKIGVCAHELGHLLFGFPDLYDTDGSSEGIGNFCLMAAGSWGGGGDTPVHPSAWCKVNQGWAAVENVTSNGARSIPDVKDSHSVLRLWKGGASGSEYFLVENRQQTGFDVSLPGSGLLIWHIDETTSTNTNEAHYKVALVQADNNKDLEAASNRGDAGDPYPGTSNNSAFTKSSAPNSMSYAGQDTCVAITSISAPSAVMTANIRVTCGVKIKKEFVKDKEMFKDQGKEITHEKQLIDKRSEKQFVNDKIVGLDKRPDKFGDGKIGEKLGGEGGGPGGPGGFGGFGGAGGAPGQADTSQLEARIAQLESIAGMLLAGAQQRAAQPFIGADLRPDLRQGALGDEDDQRQEQMLQGSAPHKRSFDTKQQDT
jgi:immune inhibitor A